MWVCGAAVEEVSREGGGRGFEPRRPRSGTTLHEKNPQLGRVASGVPPIKKDFLLFILGF
jgi:hypothetical protein